MNDVVKWPVRFVWWYVGLIYMMLGLGVFPWLVFQFWDRANVGLDLERKPEDHKHSQILMHGVAQWYWHNYEFALECFSK